MLRLVHIAAAFLITLVAFWAYALLAVPWIEPVEARPKPPDPRPNPGQRINNKEWAPLFPPAPGN